MEFGLKGRHVALLAADGTDVVQVNGLRDALREAGAVADVVGARAGRVQGPTDSSLSIERTFDACHAADYEALVIAGGGSGAQSLRADSRALQFVKEFMAADKPVAAVGDGIELLVAADAVAGRTIAVRSDRANAIRDAGGEVAANRVRESGRRSASRSVVGAELSGERSAARSGSGGWRRRKQGAPPRSG
jgi:protease I